MGSINGVIGGIADVMSIGASAAGLFGRKKHWRREDTSYQRKVNDLEAAGLNKVLAVGGSGAQSSPMQMVSGPRVGAAADAAMKGVSAQVQSQTLKNLRQQEILNAPQVLAARAETAARANVMNGPLGREYSESVRSNIVGYQSNIATLYRKANQLGVPIEFLQSGPGQQLMLWQTMQGMTPKEKLGFVGFLAAQSAAGSVKVPGIPGGKK